MIVTLQCKKCEKEYSIEINHDLYICQTCSIKEFDEVLEINSKKNRWSEFKRFTYLALIIIPFGIAIFLIYGWMVEIIFYFAVLLGQNINSILRWLNRKF